MKIRELELALFITKEPMRLDKLEKLLEVNRIELLSLIEKLNDEYKKDEKGIYIQEFDKYIQLATNNKYYHIIEKMLVNNHSFTLSETQLEVLSIIAYRGPITRQEIDYIRGVNSTYQLNILLDRDLIKISHQLDKIGNPNVYAVTNRFLRNFNLKSLDELKK